MPVWTGIALGGVLGTLTRYALNLWIQGRLVSGTWSSFPLGILVINVLGSFLLGGISTLSARGLISQELRLAFGTGFVGAFTTFSTFELDSAALLQGRQGLRGALYIGGNLFGGYGALLLGRWLVARAVT